MIRPVYINSKVALAFAAFVIACALFIASTFEGVRSSAEVDGEYGEARLEAQAEPEPDPEPELAELPDGWYDDVATDFGAPSDDAQGFDPEPDLSTEPGSQDYVVLESDSYQALTDGGEPIADE